MWVSNYLDSTITRIDPVTEKVLAEIDLQPGPQIMLEVAGSIWVSCTDFGAVQRIDPATNEVSEPITTPIAPDGLAFDGATLWVATENGPQLAAIDPGSAEVTGTWTVADEGFITANQVMAFDSGSLWLPIFGRAELLRVAPPA